MKQRPRIYYSQEQKSLKWERWQKGDSFHAIARLFESSTYVSFRNFDENRGRTAGAQETLKVGADVVGAARGSRAVLSPANRSVQ